MEKIISIETITDGEHWSKMSGYAITTDKQVVKMLIDDFQSCCESFGYFMSEDDLTQFIGAELLEITLTDTALNTEKFVSLEMNAEPPHVYEGGVMFVNIHTAAGTLQFVAYNEHNGYYGHDAKVISEQLTIERTL